MVSAGAGLTVTKICAENYAAEGIAENVDSAYTLTATVNENAFNKRVKWSVAWKDAESEWATGKTVTDYVTITPSEEGSLTATATCLKDFGEQIIITVASKVDESVNATCTVDYAQKVKSVSFNAVKGADWETYTAIGIYENNYIYVGYAGNTAMQNSYKNTDTSKGRILPEITYTEYTIKETYSREWQMKIDSSFEILLPLKGKTEAWIPYPLVSFGYPHFYSAPLTYAVAYQDEKAIAKDYSCLYGATIEGYTYGAFGEEYQREIKRIGGRRGLMYIRFVLTGTYSAYTCEEMEVVMDILKVPVPSITLDQTNLLF